MAAAEAVSHWAGVTPRFPIDWVLITRLTIVSAAPIAAAPGVASYADRPGR